MNALARRIVIWLYLVGAGAYMLYTGDAGLAGYVTALQLEWFGSAREDVTRYCTMAILVVPLFVLLVVTRRAGARQDDSGSAADGPRRRRSERLVVGGVVLAAVTIGGYLVLKEKLAPAPIHRIDLNGGPATPPANPKLATIVGELQGDYLYVIESSEHGRIKSAKVYAPLTSSDWTPDQPVVYVAELDRGYSFHEVNGERAEYSLAGAGHYPGEKPFPARLVANGIPLPVSRAYAQGGHLKLAEKAYLAQMTVLPRGDPAGTPRRHTDPGMDAIDAGVVLAKRYLDWALPTGLAIGAVVLLLGVTGLRSRTRQGGGAAAR